jgi:predicted LPLAT superfamily acyltransferase
MIAVVTLLFAFPLGFLLRDRLAAFVAYLALYLYAFTFQTGYLTRAWVQGDDSAFARQADLGLDHLAVTVAILAVGCGLVVLGHHLGSRRRSRSGGTDLDTTRS